MRVALLAAFLVSYAGITARRLSWLPVGRPAAALIGAVLCVVLGEAAGAPFLGLEGALGAVELHTLVLLLGMMLVAAGLRVAGFFGWAVEQLRAQVSTRAGLLWAVTLGCGVLSAVLVNDAVCLLATPLVVRLAREVRAPVRPFLFAVAMGSNAGSALTLAGNPQNMLVAKLSGLSYRMYVLKAGPAAVLGLLVTAGLLHLFFRRELSQVRPEAPSEPAPEVDRSLMAFSLAALTGAVLASFLGAGLALAAITAGSVVLLAGQRRAPTLLGFVDWGVLLFFAALFVLVASLGSTGYPAAWVEWVGSVLGHGALALTATLSVGSQIVSNVPLILLLEPWIRGFPDPQQAWTLTALVSTLAGNLTLLGSLANIIVLEQAQEKVGFREYAKVGVPVTLAATAVAVAVCLLWW